MVDAEADGGDGVHQPTEGAAEDPEAETRPRAPLDAAPCGEPGAERHHALEADVHDARPLAVQAAEPGEEDRRAEDQHRGERARGGQGDGVELLGQDHEHQERDQQHGDREPPLAHQPAVEVVDRLDGRRDDWTGRRRQRGDAHARRPRGRGHPGFGRRLLVLEPFGGLTHLGRGGQATHDGEGDHRRQHDRALHDRHDLRLDAGQLETAGRVVEEPEEQRADRHPDWVVLAEQGDGDAIEPEAGREGLVVEVVVPISTGNPMSPAIAPLISIVTMTIRFGFTPDVRAAFGLSPLPAGRSRSGCAASPAQ